MRIDCVRYTVSPTRPLCGIYKSAPVISSPTAGVVQFMLNRIDGPVVIYLYELGDQLLDFLAPKNRIY